MPDPVNNAIGIAQRPRGNFHGDRDLGKNNMGKEPLAAQSSEQ